MFRFEKDDLYNTIISSGRKGTMFEMQIGSSFMKGTVLFFLGICAVYDTRKKEIPIVLVVMEIFAALGVNLWQIGKGTLTIAAAGFSLLPGIFFLLISFCTREKVGYGDGLLLIMTGLCIGFAQCFLGLCIGLVLSSVFVLTLLVLHKAEKNSEIPFVPFLTIGMGVSFFI